MFIVMAATAVACSATSVTADMPLALQEVTDSTILLDASATGVLVIAGDCLALRLSDGQHWTIVWLEGRTTWDAGSQRVTMDRGPGFDDFVGVVGDEVTLGGGYADSASGFVWAAKPTGSCPDTYWLAS